MISHKCDRCGADTEQKRHVIPTEEKDGVTVTLQVFVRVSNKPQGFEPDICDTCAGELLSLASAKLTKPAAGTEA